MKRIIFILITLGLLIGESLAQVYPVQVTSQFVPPYSLRLSEYATTPIQKMYVNILLTDLTESNRRVRIKMTIRGNNINIKSADYLGERTPIYLDGGINLRLSNLDLQEHFALENLQGITPGQYRTPLPDGLYSFCFEIYDYFSGTRISSQTGCANVYLRINDPPFLNLPRQGDLVTSQSLQNIVFQWTPRHLDATNVTYEFTMRQLWDNEVDPQVAFFATPDFYTTTTMATTLLYGPAAPPLLAGKTYAWRVRAIVNQGISSTSIFRNEGYSEVFHFEHTQACDPPKFPLAQARGKTSQLIQWQENPKHLAYRVEYRKLAYEKVSDEKQETRNRKNAKRAAKGKQPKAPPQQQQVDYEWFTLNTRTTTATLQNLEANTTYQYRVGGQCTADRGYNYGSSQTFTTASSDSEVHEDEYSCGVKPEIAAFTNLDPLPKLNVNELFTAGDFPVTVKEVSGDNGTFTGEGFIVVPYLAFVSIKVKFDNIHINTDYQLTDGVVITSYDADGGGIVDVNDLGEDIGEIFTGDQGEVSDLEVPDLDIEEIEVKPNGTIVLIDEEGARIEVEANKPVVITDKNNDQWQVNEDGTSEELGKAAEGGVPTAKNTKGMGKNGKVQALTSKDIKITFTPSGYYSSDTLDESIRSEKFISEYEHLTNTEGVSVPVLYKALSDAPHATDTLEAEASFSNGKTTDDIIFKTKEGSSVPVTWNGNTAALTLTKRFDFAKQEIIATVKPSDTTGSYEIAGTVNVWHLAQQQVNVTVVPINKDIALSSEEIEMQLNNIYLPAGVRFKVKKEALFSIPVSAWDIEVGNEKLDIGDSRTLANYTVEQRAVWQYYDTQKTIATDQYYLFVWNDSTTDPNTRGFMPLKGQYGFVYGTTANAKTAAHELGHGVFGLKHPFSEYDDFPEGTTDLLMDYGEGTQLSHMDWKTMHAPGLQLYFFQKDEEGEVGKLKAEIKLYQDIIKRVEFSESQKKYLKSQLELISPECPPMDFDCLYRELVHALSGIDPESEDVRVVWEKGKYATLELVECNAYSLIDKEDDYFILGFIYGIWDWVCEHKDILSYETYLLIWNFFKDFNEVDFSQFASELGNSAFEISQEVQENPGYAGYYLAKTILVTIEFYEIVSLIKNIPKGLSKLSKLSKFAKGLKGKLAKAVGKTADDFFSTTGIRITKATDDGVLAGAKKWQGKGEYSGIDNWEVYEIPAGSKIYGGTPGQSEFYSTFDNLQGVNFDKVKYWESLQVKPDDILGFRSKVAEYTTKETIKVAISRTIANPQFGKGGGWQVFVDDFTNKLELVKEIPLK